MFYFYLNNLTWWAAASQKLSPKEKERQRRKGIIIAMFAFGVAALALFLLIFL